jgi:uncharacterized protein YebE (UPF0316 family)
MLPDNLFFGFLIIFCLRVIDVSLGTVRTVFILQGRKYLASGIALIEVSIFIYAISGVISQVGKDPILILAYSGGFATGTLLGIWLEEKFAMGYVQVRIISKDKGSEIASAIWKKGFGATVVPGEGMHGDVELLFSVIPRRFQTELVTLATTVDKESFISVSDSRYLFRGYMGLKQKK